MQATVLCVLHSFKRAWRAIWFGSMENGGESDESPAKRSKVSCAFLYGANEIKDYHNHQPTACLHRQLHGQLGRYPLAHDAIAAGCIPQPAAQLATSALLTPRAKMTGPGRVSDTPAGNSIRGAAGARSIVIHTYAASSPVESRGKGSGSMPAPTQRRCKDTSFRLDRPTPSA